MLAHGVWLDPSELELIAERGATVASNPAANMKLAVGGAFPYPAAADGRASQLGLGTDGVSSNNNLDMLEETKLFALLQKHTAADPSVLPAAEALAIARGQRSAPARGAPLAPGRNADFILLRGDAIELTAGDLDAALAYAALGLDRRYRGGRRRGRDARTRGRGRATRRRTRSGRGPSA